MIEWDNKPEELLPPAEKKPEQKPETGNKTPRVNRVIQMREQSKYRPEPPTHLDFHSRKFDLIYRMCNAGWNFVATIPRPPVVGNKDDWGDMWEGPIPEGRTYGESVFINLGTLHDLEKRFMPR